MSPHIQFENPDARYRQAPFWFWNHALDPATLDWQMDQMYEKGLGGWVMHARHGLITPYLSETWFDAVRACCEKAAERGLWAWAYDETDWPSGCAGGAVIAEPRNRLNYLRMKVEEIDGPAQIEGGKDVVAHYVAGSDGEWRREPAPVTLAAGRRRVATAERFPCPGILWFDSYLDTMDGRACDAFIQSTYAQYEAALGNLRNLGLRGFFTDEPAFSTYPDDPGRIPWTSRLPAVFRRRKKYDLLDWLPALFFGRETGRQVRFDFWDVATSLLEEHYFGRISRWCEKRGLEWIGHPLGEEPLFHQFRTVGNAFNHLKHMHIPGMDHLGIHIGKGKPEAMTPKLIASAALLSGRERCMTETFGESGWRLTLREMKFMADWQMVNGINYIVPHAFYYSVAGRRKKDSPPSEFYQSPFWPYYRHFADYTARITAALAGGEPVADVAVFYPMSSVWAEFTPGQPGDDTVRALDDGFRNVGEMLRRLHRDFLIVDEQSLSRAKVGKTGFSVNGLRFKCLVVPRITCITEKALETLKRIVESCPVLLMDPQLWGVLRSDARPEGISDMPRFDARDLSRATPVSGKLEDMAAAMKLLPPDVTVKDGNDIQYLHRRKNGKDFYFLVNTGNQPVHAEILLTATGLAEIWDPEIGGRYAAPGQRVIDANHMQVRMDLPYAGSRLFVVDPLQRPQDVPVWEFRAGRRIKLGPVWQFTPEGGNFLALTHWELSMRQEHHVTELRYKTHFVTPEKIASLRLIVDGVPARAHGVNDAARPIVAEETDATILMNGKPVTEELPWEIDPCFRVLDLRPFSRPGTHELVIIVKNNGWFPQPGLEEPVWLAGDFALDLHSPFPCLMPIRGLKTGSWEEQGYPFFSGTGAYFTEHELLPDVAGKRMFLDAGRVGHLLDLEVNVQPVGVRPWPPYRFEVTPYIEPGWNQFVLKVTNSARNFFEGPDKSFPSGLLGDVTLEVEE